MFTKSSATPPFSKQPAGATGVIVLADGTTLWGQGCGAEGTSVGEICFNTSLTGYQEILTDPSYMAQIVAFTFPHIGNVGTNAEDVEQITGVVAYRDIRVQLPLDRLLALV